MPKLQICEIKLLTYICDPTDIEERLLIASGEIR